MSRLTARLRDDRGIAAIEFAVIAPILVATLLFGAEGWMRINQVSQMRSALQTGARYYQNGGSNDADAAALAVRAWAAAAGDAQVTAARSCTCGGVGASCSTLCAGNTLPMTFINMTARGTFTGLMHSEPLTASGAVRVR